MFATISKIEDLYKFKNPEQISYQYSILSSPDLLPYSDFGIEKLHFLVDTFILAYIFWFFKDIYINKMKDFSCEY